MSIPICIFEDQYYSRLYPLSLTRPVFDLRCGMCTLKEKITRLFPKSPVYIRCRAYLADIVKEANPGVKVNEIDTRFCLFINGRILADAALPKKLETTKEHVFLRKGQIVAAFLSASNCKIMNSICESSFDISKFSHLEQVNIEVKLIDYPWELINENSAQIEEDFNYFNKGGEISGSVANNAILLNRRNIHIAAESCIKPGAVLDAENGPIFISENVTIMSNSVIEGPAFVGDHSTIKIGAKIYEGTSIGEVCKVGGEVEASIIHSYSNKQHDGFLGHAYLGQWVNLGAGTNNSDLKNNYGTVKVYIDEAWVDSGSMFVGLFMGDHAKAGINTMFNTGTVVGVMSNVFGAGFPPKFIPSFSWGGGEGFVEHELEKALETARLVMRRRGVEMSSAYERLFRNLFELTKPERDKLK